MTEKIARRGVRVLADYSVDFLDQIHVRDVGLRKVVTLRVAQTVAATRAWLAQGGDGTDHNGYPIVTDEGRLFGVVTRRDLATCDGAITLGDVVKRSALVIYTDSTLRDAADAMARGHIGRLPVVARDAPSKIVGIITRSDLVNVHTRRLSDGERSSGFLH